jgi:hypothetical protein
VGDTSDLVCRSWFLVSKAAVLAGLTKLPVDEENVDPDGLAGLAINSANHVELDMLDCGRMVF